jgi:hypothetical protein
MSFSADLEAFAKKANVNMDTVLRKIMLDVGTSLVQTTPVDTGRARANWTINVNGPDASTTQGTDLSGSQTIAKIASYNVQAGGVYFITNSLPYINRLETGWSKQAPNGMVRITAARFQKFVSTAVVGMK